MSFAKTRDETQIAYEIHGDGALKMILLHGWGGSASYWRELVTALSCAGMA